MKMNYRVSGLCALLLAATVGCADDIVVDVPIDDSAYVEPEDPSQPAIRLQDVQTGKTDNDVQFIDGVYNTSVRVSLREKAEEATTLNAKVDFDYLAAYNAEHGTDYASFPEELIEFGNDGRVVIEAGADRASFDLQLSAHPTAALGETFAVPVTIAVPGAADVDAGHCIYLITVEPALRSCFKGDDLPRGMLIFDGGVNPLNALGWQLEDGRLIFDAVVLFAANINHHASEDRPYIQLNSSIKFLLDNHDTYLKPLQDRGMKVLLGMLGNHDQAGLAQLSVQGARGFAAEVAHYCKAYDLDGVYYDDEYSQRPDLTHPAYTTPSYAAAARLCYETKKAMPEKLVCIFSYGYMSSAAMPREIEGETIAQWLDITTANYGGMTSPVGDLTLKNCSGASIELALGTGGDIDQYTASTILRDRGYGWFMCFAPDPYRTRPSYDAQFNRISGLSTIYDSRVAPPSIFYKHQDPTPYRYPQDL